MAQGLTFDEATHTYRWDTRTVPSVTQVLADLKDWSRFPAERLRRVQQEGIALHKMAELDLLGQLDDVPDWMMGKYAGWLKFRAEQNFSPIVCEQVMFHAKYRYAGRPDMFGKISPGEGIYDNEVLIDLKRSLYAGRVIGLQLAAYMDLLRENGYVQSEDPMRAALVLNDDGTYLLQPYSEPMDRAIWMACLTRYHFMEAS